MSKKDLKSTLSPLSYAVACEGGTEKPFDNAFWDHKEEGLYVDIISGKALFASVHKFDSGTGWPSFSRPVAADEIIEIDDLSLPGRPRTEVRGRSGDSHLGHVFNDGPAEEGGMRYCINSASLRFIPLEELDAQGYGEFLKLFKK